MRKKSPFCREHFNRSFLCLDLENPGIRAQNLFYMYINTHVHIHINIKAEHPPISPHNLLLLKLVTELAELFRSGYSAHAWHGEFSSARAEHPGRDMEGWVMEADLGEQPGEGRE